MRPSITCIATIMQRTTLCFDDCKGSKVSNVVCRAGHAG